jgi:hypothetical protein
MRIPATDSGVLPKQSTTFATCDLRLSSIGGFWAFEFKSPTPLDFTVIDGV